MTNTVVESGQSPVENKNATRSMWLGLGSIACCALTGLPAVVLGVIALRSGNPAGRRKAWVGIVAGAAFSLCWGAMWLIVRAADAEQAERQLAETKLRQQEAIAARQKAEAEAPQRIEEAQQALDAGQAQKAVELVPWLRGNGLAVPPALGTAFARDALSKARKALGENKFGDVRTFAASAETADPSTAAEAKKLVTKAADAETRIAEAQRRAEERKAAEEKRKTEARARKDAVDLRKIAARELEQNMLRQGQSVTVSTRRADASLLHVEWVLCSKATLFNLTDGSAGRMLDELGFTRVECSDGYEGVWGVSFGK